MKHKNKGFTLVELIVVLVILAILAVLLVPALTGYIDKAKEKKVIAETPWSLWLSRRWRPRRMVRLALAMIYRISSLTIGHLPWV